MKKIFVLLFLALSFVLNLNAQQNKFELAIRNIKLANSYKESKDFESAIKFIDKAKKSLNNYTGESAKYWRAAAYENAGYIYKEMGMIDFAKSELRNALNLYKSLIKQKDGSLYAVNANIENINKAENDLLESERSGLNPKFIKGKTVNFDNCKLKALDKEIPGDVENISAAENRIKDFPNQVFRLKKLKYLNLRNNRIVNLNISEPNGKIEWLDLSNNKIKELPENINKFNNLTFLDLSNNKLKDLPTGLMNLKKLKWLNLKNNKIPFDKLKNIIKALPETNIMHDEYILKGKSEPEEPNNNPD